MQEMVHRIDDYGQAAWIALMVLGFIVFWPIGLGVLAFLLWSGRMGCGSRGDSSRGDSSRVDWRQRFAGGWGGGRRRGHCDGHRRSGTGNRAFDEYRDEALKRLEEESREFRSFLDRLRMAKDRAEFDQFMSERGKPDNGAAPSDGTA